MISAETIMRLMEASERTEFPNSRVLYYKIDGREFRLRSTYSVEPERFGRWQENIWELTIGMRSSIGFVIKAVFHGHHNRDAFTPADFVITKVVSIETGLERLYKSSDTLSKNTLEHHLMMLILEHSE